MTLFRCNKHHYFTSIAKSYLKTSTCFKNDKKDGQFFGHNVLDNILTIQDMLIYNIHTCYLIYTKHILIDRKYIYIDNYLNICGIH